MSPIEWTITLTDSGKRSIKPLKITLKGDLPHGHPTETWVDDQLLDRDEEGGDFSWNLDAGLSQPVALIEAMNDCDQVRAELAFWADSAAKTSTDILDSKYRQIAYTEAARRRLSDLGCQGE